MSRPELTLREIRIFVSVYEERSFTVAAVREHATQSGISQHIRHIESELGVTLFDRRKGVEPTAAGRIYYERCQEILRANGEALQSLSEYSTGVSGDASIGLSSALTSCQAAHAHIRFVAQNPNAIVRLIEASNALLLERVATGDLDLAIVASTEAFQQGMQASHFAATRQFLVSSRHSKLVHGRSVILAQEPQLRLVLQDAPGTKSAVLDYIDVNCPALTRMSIDGILGTLDLVRQSNWSAVVPGLILIDEIETPSPERDFTINPIDRPAIATELVTVHLETRPPSPVALAYLAALREVTTDHLAALERFISHSAQTDVAE